MSTSKVRAILALVVVIGVVLTTSLLMLFSAGFFGSQPEGVTENPVKDYFSLFSGLLGTILGYYFAKTE